MATPKQALKAARTALEQSDYASAATHARAVLAADPTSYFGHVLLGRALEKQSDAPAAAAAYRAATAAKPDDDTAWKGLCSVHESTRDIDGYTAAGLRLAALHAERDDAHAAQSQVDRVVALAKAHGSRAQYAAALRAYLPDHALYGVLEGRVQPPALTFRRLAEMADADDRERINREIGERRLRLGVRLGSLTADVTREVYGRSGVEELYQRVVDWTADDEERREFEEKLLRHAYEHLVVLEPGEAKERKREVVMRLALGMVVIKHAMPLAWRIECEWQDPEGLGQLDTQTLLEYVRLFPAAGLARVIQGFLGVRVIVKEGEEGEAEEDDDKVKPLGAEDRLIILTDGIADAADSALAHRMVAQHYLTIEEWESSVEASRKALQLLQAEANRSGLALANSFDATLTNLGTALVFYQSPKNHPEAKALFDGVLQRKPNATDALLGVGLIYKEQEDFDLASSFLERALHRDPSNIRVAAEAAWCKALKGDAQTGLRELEACAAQLKELKNPPLDLKAEVSYRIGKCQWDLEPDRAARKSRQGPYAHFLAALKANPSFAPAYTALGIYYADYARDRKRARQCFQKAFELSASEIVAAHRLAQDFARTAEWDIVEVVAQRAIDSGVVRPAPGSKRKPVSWPFAALAVVQMSKQEYPLAVHSYQAALRIAPSDAHAWLGLGESYLSSGRYNAASRVLERAQDMMKDSPDSWFALYMHSNVRRELGDYDDAIAGYRQVLKERGSEFGVSIALLQTLVEAAQDSVAKGFFEKSAGLARDALSDAAVMVDEFAPTVNFWKAIGDACAVFAALPALKASVPVAEILKLLSASKTAQQDPLLEGLDSINLKDLEDSNDADPFVAGLIGSILAQKQAVKAAHSDVHARAVAWYNLGWTEYLAYHVHSSVAEGPVRAKLSQGAKASVKCFKHAIELEAGNADFWNALGVVTTPLNPRVAQHSFVRSLHLNERSARTWTNLGALYMFQEDIELAHEAFARAQSTEPDYVYSWLGEGLIALHLGDENEARSHFTHAVEIADASALMAKEQFVASSFDRLLADQAPNLRLDGLMSPIFALQQIQMQSLDLLRYRHLLALLQERVGDFEPAVENLAAIADEVEQVYEASESASSLGQYIRLKADLARCQLAARMYTEASENAGTALDLSEELGEDVLQDKQRTKARLSAHLTAGVARYYSGEMDDAIQMFRAALEESGSEPDVVCLLARVLWAKGSSAERGVAKEQLLDTVEKHSGHVEATMLLGAMTLLDEDRETHEAVVDDLQSMRGGAKLSMKQQSMIDELLQTSAAVFQSGQEQQANEINRAIMLAPDQPSGWSELAQLTAEENALDMALATAARAVPPDGPLLADDLSKAYADAGSNSSVQKGIMLSPWRGKGWSDFGAALGATDAQAR